MSELVNSFGSQPQIIPNFYPPPQPKLLPSPLTWQRRCCGRDWKVEKEYFTLSTRNIMKKKKNHTVIDTVKFNKLNPGKQPQHSELYFWAEDRFLASATTDHPGLWLGSSKKKKWQKRHTHLLVYHHISSFVLTWSSEEHQPPRVAARLWLGENSLLLEDGYLANLSELSRT